MPLVYGVGVNDSDYPVHSRSYVNSKGTVTNVCPYYAAWKRMLQRAYSQKFHEKNQAYSGTSVCDQWLKFSEFRSWMEQQPWQGMELDKDLTVWGNRQYSASACSFVPAKVNSLLLDCGARKGEFPTGVYAAAGCPRSPYRARLHTEKGVAHLGYFASPEAAHAAWCVAKAKSIEDVVKWWETDASVSHTFSENAGRTLLALADRLKTLKNKELANEL